MTIYVVKFVTENYQSPGNYGKLTYLPGTTVEVEDYDPAEKGQCAKGIHVIPIAPDANFTNVFYEHRLILLEVDEADILYREGNGKMRVKKARVLGDLYDYPEHLENFIKSPQGAVSYAQFITCEPDMRTRDAACQQAKWAYVYAYTVDRAPREDTRVVACQEAEYAYYYARDVDKISRDDTRRVACQSAQFAYSYAVYVDRSPRDDTRTAACQAPGWAYKYAMGVDGKAHEDTRKAACQVPEWTYKYALSVDQAFHPDTYEALANHPEWLSRYETALGKGDPTECTP